MYYLFIYFLGLIWGLTTTYSGLNGATADALDGAAADALNGAAADALALDSRFVCIF